VHFLVERRKGGWQMRGACGERLRGRDDDEIM
jgi:hypothetical protein